MAAKKVITVALVTMLGLLTSATAHAQSDLATIVGQATDPGGGALPGVTVTAASPVLQVRQVTTVTDDRGEYRISNLPIGIYSVSFALDGFQGASREGLRLTAGFTAKVDIGLSLGTVSETVVVSGLSPLVDVTSAGSATTLTRETLEVLPTSRDGILAVLAQTPGARPNIDVGGNTMADVPNTKIYGRDLRPWNMVEGVFTTSITLRQGGQYTDYGMLEEVVVRTHAHDASIGLPGEALSTVFKSGGNVPHGDVVWTYTNDSLSANNVSGALRTQGIGAPPPILRRWDFGGTFSGKVVQDKVWFSAGARVRYNDNGVLGCVKGIEGGGQHNTEQCENDAQTVYYTGKLSYQLNPANRFVGVFAYNEKNTEARSHSAQITWRARTGLDQYGLLGKAEWSRVIGNQGVVEFNYGYWNLDFTPLAIERTGIPNQRDIGTGILDGDQPGNGGEHARWVLNATTTWDMSAHAIKAGWNFHQAKRDGRRFANPTGDYQLVFNRGVPLQFVTFATPGKDRVSQQYTSAYLQDQWRVSDRLTLNLGLRFAHDLMYLPEQSQLAGQFAIPAEFSRVDFAAFNTLVPRIHAAFDIRGDARSVIKTGWARYAELRDTAIGAAVNRNGGANRTYRWNDRNGDRLYQTGEVNLAINSPDLVAESASNTQIPNPDQKPYLDDQFSLSLEHQLANMLAVRVTGLYERQTRVPRLLNTQIPYEAYNIPITRAIPNERGVAPGDSSLGTITYYEYSTAFRGLQFQVPWVVNDPNASRSWSTLELALTKRLSNRWMALGSFSTTKKNEPLVPYIPGYGGFRRALNVGSGGLNPNEEINGADTTREWTLRMGGSYQLPWDVIVSTNYQVLSGEKWGRTALFTGGVTIPTIVLNIEPVGSRSFPTQHLLDVRVEKTVRLFGGHSLGLRAELFNLPNMSTLQSQVIQSGPTFGRPLSILPGRNIHFGATYKF